MMKESGTSKSLRARELGVYRGTFYYHRKKPERDWDLKCRIERVLEEYPSYGSRRIAIHLKLNRKRVKRVMNLFGIKPYRRRGRRFQRKKVKVVYPNLLKGKYPKYPNHIWTSDFTHVVFQGRTIYIATVMDLYTRKIVGLSVLTTHAVQLVLASFLNAIHNNSRPLIFHSDNGSEYNSEIFIGALKTLGILISRSTPGCPWENGYQESFHSQFKIDLGDPGRFRSLGEFVYEIYQTIYTYNNSRIHSAFNMSPQQFALHSSILYNSHARSLF